MSGVGNGGIGGTPVDPDGPGGELIAPSELAPPPFDPAYLIYSGGMWGYAPPPAGGILNNYGAVTAPTAGDDTADGYAIGSEWINTSNGNIYKCVDATLGAAVWSQTNGGGGGSGNDDTLIVAFAYDTPSPLIIGNIYAGDQILRTEVEINTPFDVPEATIAVGTAAIPGLFLAIQDISPDIQATFGSDSNYAVAADTLARLTISPGGSTQGSGRVLLTLKRA